MKIFKLFPYTDDQYAYIAHTGLSFDIIDRIIDGERIDTLDLSQMVVKNKTKHFPDLIGTGMTEFFVTNQLKNFLIKHVKGHELNFVKVEIATHAYWLLNIIGLRDCMDYERSTYTTYEKFDKPDQITKLVIREDQVSELDIFRISDRPELVFVTESLKSLMESKGFTGIRFFEGTDLTTFSYG